MAQIFGRGADLKLRLALLGALILVAGGVFAWHAGLPGNADAGEPIAQPAPFSHKHHVAEDGIDCRYCHTSVEDSSFAGIPPIHTCMTCHSQLYQDSPMLAPLRAAMRGERTLAWNRVNDLPDFVFFDHGIHVAKGVGCVTCHGRVDRMPLTWRARTLDMQWCLACHRAPERYLRPRERVFDMAWQPQDQPALGRRLVREYGIRVERLTDCSICHR
ncbi:MAG TPA: cytochrome c3 family protein [Pelomicrobium sp.]|nr:cytochrome c3 family protein [Pelomicrobium sp.]